MWTVNQCRPWQCSHPFFNPKSSSSSSSIAEGVLCLELAHQDEGQSTKWLKIKGRAAFPNVVRVTKEVTIPCPAVPPPLFSSPSHSHAGQSFSRVGSCTSHSSKLSIFLYSNSVGSEFNSSDTEPQSLTRKNIYFADRVRRRIFHYVVWVPKTEGQVLEKATSASTECVLQPWVFYEAGRMYFWYKIQYGV